MEWIVDLIVWFGLVILIVLEIVFGIDNLVFIVIFVDKLLLYLCDCVWVFGLLLVLLMCLGLLVSILWMVIFIELLFEVFGKSFFGCDLIMLFGGVFLLFKVIMELYECFEGYVVQYVGNKIYVLFWLIVVQIVVFDVVFLFDVVIIVVGMVEYLEVMMIVVIVFIGLMIVVSKLLICFVNCYLMVIMLCLGFLMMIGFSLIVEGLGFYILKGYLYVVIGFLIFIEVFNQVVCKCCKKSLQGYCLLCVCIVYVVLCLFGGQCLEVDEVGEEVVDLFEEGDDQVVFDCCEWVMISGVL